MSIPWDELSKADPIADLRALCQHLRDLEDARFHQQVERRYLLDCIAGQLLKLLRFGIHPVFYAPSIEIVEQR